MPCSDCEKRQALGFSGPCRLHATDATPERPPLDVLMDESGIILVVPVGTARPVGVRLPWRVAQALGVRLIEAGAARRELEKQEAAHVREA